jgi:peptidoglycan/xylan/chitin deacetylase (PgdA/CDA1 family)
MHHPILSYLSNIDEAEHEIQACKRVIEGKLGHPVRSFAYPVGQRQHLGPEVVELVRKAGFSWALTTKYGMNTSACNPYVLRRVEVDVDQHWLVLAAEAAGLWGFFSRLRWQPFIRQRFTNAAR